MKPIAHHASYLIAPSSHLPFLISHIDETHGISALANPDFFNRQYTNFTIDDAREMKSFHEMRPVHESGKKIFVIAMNGITVEAQNALLKLFEEPAEYAHFFLIIPSAHLLLPTVKSRMQEYKLASKDAEEGDPIQSAEKFLKAAPAKRLEIIKGLMDEITKEKKTKQDAIEFLNAVESVALKETGIKDGFEAIEAIQVARRFISDRAPSVKMLLEYVALNC